MPCYSPLNAYRIIGGENKETGKWPLTFKKLEGHKYTEIKVPCGRCIGCRLEKSRQWAMRMECEKFTQGDSSFLTLTYTDENLPISEVQAEKNKFIPTLRPRDVTLFLKRLRKELDDEGIRIRYFAAGEYGEKKGRPHYHLAIFNYDFPDKKIITDGRATSDFDLYESPQLNRLWPYGFHAIGELTFDSAAYIASYVTKKLTGDKSIQYNGALPEFARMSRMPGIGQEYFGKYGMQIMENNKMVMRGRWMTPPKYFQKLLEKYSPENYTIYKYNRFLEKHESEHETIERLIVRNEIRKRKLNKSKTKRGYENGS